MIKRPIRDLHSDRQTQTRFCDVVIDGNNVYLEQKKEKNTYVTISWDDVVYQVEAAKEKAIASK
jgi:hypothetical protein